MTSSPRIQDDSRLHIVTVEADRPPGPQALPMGRALKPDEWFVFAAKCDLHPRLLDLIMHATQRRPDVDVFYGDDVSFADEGSCDLSLKPDWDQTLFAATDYVGLPVIIRGSALGRLGAIDPSFRSASIYEWLLRANAEGVGIARIPEVLARYPRARYAATVQDRRRALTRDPKKHGPALAVADGLTAESLRAEPVMFELPALTLVIATAQFGAGDTASSPPEPFVIELLNSIAQSSYPMDRLHVLIGDDSPDDSIYAGRSWPFQMRRLTTQRAEGEPFNYARKMNLLWREAGTEHVILLNDDITARSVDWIQALVRFSSQPNVGGVGARLLYPDGKIQHAGMPGGVFGLCTHAWIGQDAAATTYQNWAVVQREWSMVTGAVFATRKSVLEEVNGFEEAFALDFNDVDLCLRLRMLGYRIVYTPFAELVHHEKGSRGGETWPASELALFLRRWSDFLHADPAFHPKLSKSTNVVQPAPLRNEWWQGTVPA